jgi:hypothetical protein
LAKEILSHAFRATVSPSYPETSLTSGAFGTETPKVLIVHAFRAGTTAQSTLARNSQSLAVWCDEGTAFPTPICHFIHEEENQGTTDTSSGFPNWLLSANTPKLSYIILNSTGASVHCSGIVTAIAGGIKITPDDQGTSIELNVLALGGDGIKSTSLDLLNTGNMSSFPYTQSLTNSSCNPDLLFSVSTMGGYTSNTGADDARYSFGIAGMHQGTTLKQYVLSSNSESGLNTPNPRGAIFDNAICGSSNGSGNSTQEDSLEVSSFGSGEYVLDEVAGGLVASSFVITTVAIELEDAENINIVTDSMTGNELVKDLVTAPQYLRNAFEGTLVGLIHTSDAGDGSVNSIDRDYGHSILFQKGTTVVGGSWTSGHQYGSTSTSSVSATRLDKWGVAVDNGNGDGGVTYTTGSMVDSAGYRQYRATGLSGPDDKGIFFAALILTKKSTGVYYGAKRVQQILHGTKPVLIMSSPDSAGGGGVIGE